MLHVSSCIILIEALLAELNVLLCCIKYIYVYTH